MLSGPFVINYSTITYMADDAMSLSIKGETDVIISGKLYYSPQRSSNFTYLSKLIV